MAATMEQKKAEAIRRMKILKILPETIKQFDKDGKVSLSEPPIGAFYWANKEQQEVIKKFEEEYDALVYMGIRSYTRLGVMDTYFYVSNYPEEWKMDREDLEYFNRAYCYVYNNDEPVFSEIGCIGFERTPAASLRRIY